jgi:ABC-type sugar transport system permease subunit
MTDTATQPLAPPRPAPAAPPVALETERHVPLLQRIWLSKRLYLYIFPALALLLTFSYWPAISALYHAFFIWHPFGDPEFVGLANFKQLYGDLFRPVGGLAPQQWPWLQAAAWLGGIGLVAFALVAPLWPRHGAIRLGVSYALLTTALATVAASLAVSLFTGLGTARPGELVFWHGALLGLGILQWVSWRKVYTGATGSWPRLMALATFLVAVTATFLLLRYSEGGDLRASCWNLLRLMAFQLTIGLFMPLVIAEAIFNLRNDRSKYLYRVLLIVPMVVPGIVGTLMWLFIYDYNWGVLNQLFALLVSSGGRFAVMASLYAVVLYIAVMKLLGRWSMASSVTMPLITTVVLIAGAVLLSLAWLVFATTPFIDFTATYSGFATVWNHVPLDARNWLGDSNLALYSIMFMGFPWVGTISMLIFYAGLQSIPTSVLESAKLDGATGLRRFISIDFPLILGQFKLLLILGIIGGIQAFQTVLILTYGGPGKSTQMPGLTMFREAFNYGNLGYGTTIGVVMFLIILLLTYVNMKYIRPSAEEDAR